ncbi:MAG: sulfotransferase [Rhizobium sp.]|nr:sulfotransferase [Rhizobium sp.]
MAMPDFIGIGAQKAGTTWLYDMLAQNPSIWLPPLKEVHFFDYLDAPPARRLKRAAHIEKVAGRLERGKLDKGSEGDGAAKAAHLRSLVGDHLLTQDWYGSIFDYPDAKGRVTGEITPAYLELDEKGMATLSDMLPKTRFVLIIREPAARTMSQLKMAVARSKADPSGGTKDWAFFLKKIKTNTRGNYQTAIPLWQQSVGAERLLIRPFGMVRHQPAALIREIEAFIGAEHFDSYTDMSEPSHKTKEVAAVPDWVAREVEEMAAPQKDYLIEAFGEEFYKNTR